MSLNLGAAAFVEPLQQTFGLDLTVSHRRDSVFKVLKELGGTSRSPRDLKFAVHVPRAAVSLAHFFGGSAAQVGQLDAARQHVDFRARLAPLHGETGSEHVQSCAFGRDLQRGFFELRLHRDDQQAVDQTDLVPFDSAENNVAMAEDREPRAVGSLDDGDTAFSVGQHVVVGLDKAVFQVQRRPSAVGLQSLGVPLKADDSADHQFGNRRCRCGRLAVQPDGQREEDNQSRSDGDTGCGKTGSIW